MKSDHEASRESNRPDEARDATKPPRQVVVVNYGNRKLLLWVVVVFSVVVSICGILIYHRLVIEPDLARATEEAQALLDGINENQDRAAKQATTQPSGPLASSSTPKSANSTGAVVPQPSPIAKTAAPLPRDAAAPSLAQRDNAPSRPSVAKLPEPPAPVATPAKPKSDGQSKVVKSESTTKAVKQQSVVVTPSPPRAEPESAPARKPQPAVSSGPVVAQEPKPAPPKEEVPRPIPEETPDKRAEADPQQETPQPDPGALKYEERLRFREELKIALQQGGNQAGTEIDKLLQQYRYNGNDDKLKQASRTWFFGRISRPAKVRWIRSLDLPESVFIDFLSVDLERLIGARNGPRDMNDVRVRAAKILLTYELPAPERAPVPAGRVDRGDAPARLVQPTVAGTWPFLPERDRFRPDALLDLRGLNERVAGQSGFVRLAPDGESFVLGDGTPARFWGVTTFVQRDRSAADLAQHARFLAKRGVNMVRLHGHIEPRDKNARLTDVDGKSIDEAWKLVAAMKKEGIYVTISPYWADSIKSVPSRWGIEGWPENKSPFGLLFFNPKLQSGYKAWLKALMTRPNPYTGIPLAQDPALAIIQLQNEDSLLFWSVQGIDGKQGDLLGRQFGDWLKAKYGSLAEAFQAWGNDKAPEDRVSQGIVARLMVWEWTQPREGGRKRRLDDQLQFYAETMFRFNREIERYLHQDLGCKQLVNAGNWKTADAVKLDDVERWSYTANEVLAVNRYYAPAHVGPNSGWRIDPGDSFEDTTVLLQPRQLPVNLRQASGHPMMVTESHWVPPRGYQSEGPFLVASFQSLSGVDVFYWFCTTEAEWSSRDRDGDSPSRAKWTIATPMILGQFPGAALLFRKGYLKEGQPVIEEHRPLREIWERVPPVLAEDPGYDPNRDIGNTARTSSQTGRVEPLAFLAGPVKVHYGSAAELTKLADLGELVDPKAKVVRANTGQIRFDYGRGLCTIDAPKAQGVTGFLKNAGSVDLSDVTIDSRNSYATVLVVSLDDDALSRSRRVFVQVGTRARPTGWFERDNTFKVDDGKRTIHGKQVVNTGRMPWAVEDTKVTLGVKSPVLTRATALDLNGNARGDLAVTASDGVLKVELPRDAMYMVLQSQ
jgi:hypothetical protein